MGVIDRVVDELADPEGLSLVEQLEAGARLDAAAARVIRSLSARLRQARLERDEARGNARVLAHAYDNDARPPARVVREALAYPANPGNTAPGPRVRPS